MMVAGLPVLLRLAAAGLYYGRLIRPLSLAVGYTRRSPVIPILAYHRVNDERDPFFPSIPTGVFERHMAYIGRAYRVLTVEELADRMRHGDLPRNALAITFDDGYRDNLTHAAPILTNYGLPATIFLATGLIGTGEMSWFDRLALALKSTAAQSVAAPWDEMLPLHDQGDRVKALYRLLDYLKRLPDDEMRRTLNGIITALGVKDVANLNVIMLNWDEVRTLAGKGFAIGAHTVTHPILSRVSAARAWREIMESRRMIESACGRPPKAFAYPNGKPEDYTETVKHMVREAGFACAVTTRFGFNTGETSPYELKRGGPWEEHLPTFALKLAGYRLMTV
jgi:peptidoglycan/xylan/chitin deacetylase (PgdA/CDA1 family)